MLDNALKKNTGEKRSHAKFIFLKFDYLVKPRNIYCSKLNNAKILMLSRTCKEYNNSFYNSTIRFELYIALLIYL